MATIAEMTYIHFRDGDDEFVARGKGGIKPVYSLSDNVLSLTEMTFPSCLNFMPDAEELETSTKPLKEIPAARRQIMGR